MSPSKNFVRKSLVAAIALALSGLSIAEPATDLDIIVVTASRFSENVAQVGGNVTVISAEDIQKSPALSVPDLLKTKAGIDVRGLYGNMGIDSTVDMRGFGETAGSNVLVLVDGVRFNPIDMSGIAWASIPTESIRRIEIMRGSGTVLYGDRATGGVINIITDKSGKPRTSIETTVGSYGYRGVNLRTSGGTDDGLYGNFVTHYAATDGYRDNSAAEQQAVTGRLGKMFGGNDVFVDFLWNREFSATPGSLIEADFDQRPRWSRTPHNNQLRESYRVRPGGSFEITPSLRFDVEGGVAHSDYHSLTVEAFKPRYQSDSDTVFFTPRAKWQHGLGALVSETVFGYDYYDGRVHGVGYLDLLAKQKTEAGYLQNTTWITERLSSSIGYRTQSARQEAVNVGAGLRGSTRRTRDAYDIALSYQAAEGVKVYAKSGTTFRFPNTDELFGYDPILMAIVFSGDVRPQHGSTHELGGSFSSPIATLKAAVFETTLTDEIGYDPIGGQNVNFDKTRRKGFEAEGSWKIGNNTQLRGSYTFLDAKFVAGPYEGKQITLVPRQKAAIELRWDGGQLGTWSAVGNYVGERYLAGDFTNEAKKLPAYSTADLVAAWDFKPWHVSARLLNVFDKRYAAFGQVWPWFVPPPGNYYYPADGRSFFLSARYDFK